MDNSKNDPLLPRAEDKVHAPGTALLKAAITTGATVAGMAINPAAGIAGGAVGNVFSDWLVSEIAQPLSKRRDSWLRELHGDLSRIEKKVDYLSEDVYEEDRFSCAVVSALRIAEKTYDEEKLKLLRNAVCNIFLGVNVESDIESIFWRCVDEFSVSHIKIMVFASNPMKWMLENGIEDLPGNDRRHEMNDWVKYKWKNVKDICLSELRSSDDLYSILISDLTSKGLILGEPINDIENTSRLENNTLTTMGKLFLRFVSEPKATDIQRGEI